MKEDHVLEGVLEYRLEVRRRKIQTQIIDISIKIRLK